jgi:hypothetical protein
VPRRDTVGSTRLHGAGALVDRELRFIANRALREFTLSDNHPKVSIKTVFEEIVIVIFVIAVYVALPAGIIPGWIRWLRLGRKTD